MNNRAKTTQTRNHKMKETIMLLGEDDWTTSLGARSNEIEYLRPKDPVREIAIALIMSGYVQLLDSIKLSVHLCPLNFSSINKYTDPRDIKLEYDTDVLTGKEYSEMLLWFLKERSEEIFSFDHCCSVIGLNSQKVRDRIEFIQDCRSKAVSDIRNGIDKDNIDSILNLLEMRRIDLLEKAKDRILCMKKNGVIDNTSFTFSKYIQISHLLRDQFKEKFNLEKC